MPTADDAVRAALPGATLVWLESPSNPGLDVARPARARRRGPRRGRRRRGRQHARGPAAPAPARARRRLLGDERLQAPRRPQRPHHGRRRRAPTPSARRALRAWRIATGAIPGPFEAWLAHRSLATLALRLERQEANAARARRARCAPATTSATCAGRASGSVVCFDVGSQARADALPGRLRAGGAGHELRRPALQRRAPRALGHRRRRRGLHPLQRRDRGRADLLADLERALELSRP